MKTKRLDETCTVLSLETVTSDCRLLRLAAPRISANAVPGQFVHLRIPTLEASALRRPLSIYSAQDGVLELLFKIVGRGTAALAETPLGASISVLGPLGRGFPQPKKDILPVCVAGGYGVAPFVFMARTWRRTGIVVIGGRTKTDILSAAALKKAGWKVLIATQDGSQGTKGLVTVPLCKELERLAKNGTPVELFACGPNGMLKAIGDLAEQRGYDAWLSLDERMVCGVGACLACVQKLRRADGSDYLGRVCEDGPVFNAREIVW